jgi:hypothetical protein
MPICDKRAKPRESWEVAQLGPTDMSVGRQLSGDSFRALAMAITDGEPRPDV